MILDNSSSIQDEFSSRAHSFANIHADIPTEKFASNLHSRVKLLQVGEVAMPITLNQDEKDNAWVCSLKTTYCDYAIEEADRYFPGIFRRPIRLLLKLIGIWFVRAGIDRVVSINNWLLSTNIYPVLASVPLNELLEGAFQRWPGYALCFRSLNVIEHQDWLAELETLGFQLIASRQVYLYENIPELTAKHINLKRDLSLLGKTRLIRIGNNEVGEPDYSRIAALYSCLYLEKYSRLNPDYTEEFMRQWHKGKLLEFEGFRDEHGSLVAVIGFFRQGKTITAPIVGYDTQLPRELALYRLLTACAYEKTQLSDLRLNFSAGAAEFKRLRGGAPAIEYSAIYVRHLSRSMRYSINVLSWLTQRIGIPLMKRYKL